jgi:hypothetical protein
VAKLVHPVPDPLLARIGDITVSFALLESVMQSLAQTLLGRGSEIGQIVTVELSFQRLRALTANLYRANHGEDADFELLTTLLKRAADVEEKRNQITHSIWAAGDPGTITRIKMTAKEKRGFALSARAGCG